MLHENQEKEKREYNYHQLITQAWKSFDDRFSIKRIFDASPHVSTNQVYKISFHDRKPVFAKFSDYGTFTCFREDHIIINNLANNLEAPYDNFLAHSLIKNDEVFIYRFHEEKKPAWVVFYNPIRTKNKLPRRLNEDLIRVMGRELAKFHRACTNVSKQLPAASKTIISDTLSLISQIDNGNCQAMPHEQDIIKHQAEIFLNELERLNYRSQIQKIPVFVDWNIGNFSVRNSGTFFSRWDYDWFRISSRVLDFYFFSRVVSDLGDKTAFSYVINTLNEERFLIFLEEYHQIYPLTELEIHLIKEAYRFFILNYVIKDGNYFFRPSFAQKLQKEAYQLYLPAIDSNFNVDLLLKKLKI